MSSSPLNLETVSTRQAPGFSNKTFDLRLQTIRGLAALVVTFHHSFNLFLFPPGSARVLRGVEGVISPQTAVLTFFILSGHVLGLSLARNPRFALGGYLQFMIKRICRIMVPLWVIILLISAAVIAPLWFTTGSTFVDPATWRQPSLIATSFNRPFDLQVLARNLFLMDHDLDPVTWTITIEMAGSALLPIFFWINRFSLGRGPLLLVLMVLARVNPADGASFWHYLYMFDLGLLLSHWGPGVFSYLQKRGLVFVVLFVAIFLCAINSHFGHNFYILSVALSFLLGFVIFRNHPVLDFLDARIFIWLGKISYSFYLLHWPVVWLMAWLWMREVPPGGSSHPVLVSLALFVGSVPLAALLADVSYNWIELPAIHVGKRLTGKSLR